jgi:hypothetical protein
MSKRKYQVRAECPHCACGSIAHISPEMMRERFIGDEKEIDVVCPLCATKTKGRLEEVPED